ncbi:MAG: serine/threonine protein kinase [Acidiferrobacter sp.]
MTVDSPESLPYQGLTPEVILAATESVGLQPTGALQALNSYENRVYRIDTEHERWAIKFYRPDRWSDATIGEEHRFTAELAAAEIPAVPPLAHDGQTLFTYAGFRFSLFPWHAGRAGGLETRAERVAFGRYLGRLHMAGRGTFTHRPTLDVAGFVDPALITLAECPFLPPDLQAPFAAVGLRLRAAIDAAFRAVDAPYHRRHGDCHPGNVLFDGERFSIVDFDDCLNGPAMQDLWMLFPGDCDEQEEALDAVAEGYEMFQTFPYRELALIEPLRALRLLHYNAWVARRYHDPAFPRAFPWFSEDRHWRELLGLLNGQEQRLNGPPLSRGRATRR